MKICPNGIADTDGLRKLCDEAAKYGIKIVVDVVANHINNSADYRDPKWNDTSLWHSAVYKGIDFNNRNSITHDNLGDYPDLNSESELVQQYVAAYVAELKAAGVKGIRWDAAKHIGLPTEKCKFWKAVTAEDGMWHYGEILDGPGGSNQNNLMKEYANYISVTDTRYSDQIRSQIEAGGQVNARGSWSVLGVPANKIVYWGESHDTYSNNDGNTKHTDQGVIDRAWALGACRSGATSLYFSRPFETDNELIRVGAKGSTHFTSPQIAAVNHLRNAMGDTPESIAVIPGVTVVTRGGGGACIVVSAGLSRSVSITNAGSNVAPGTYTDEVSGNQFTVTASTISGKVGEAGIAVIYPGSAPVPAVIFEPGASTFYTPTLKVKASLVNASEGSVSVAGRTAVAINSEGTEFVIGKDIDSGEISLSWTTKSGGITRQGTAVYTKIDPDARPADMPQSFYIMGEVEGNGWDPAQGVEMTASGSRFSATVHIDGYFSFAERLGAPGDWAGFNAAGIRYGFATDTTASLGEPVTFAKLGDPKAMNVSGINSGKSYTVTVDWARKTVTVDEAAGIEDVEFEDIDAPVVYYTLDGRLVSGTPAPGVYIMRRGSKVSKVLIR